MNITTFQEYLKNKSGKINIEDRVLIALEDTEFFNEYKDLIFRVNENQFNQVVSDPKRYDNPINPNFYPIYQKLLIEISNAYTSYFLNKKTKYSVFKKDIDEIENRIDAVNRNIENIKNTSELITGAKVLQVYADEFQKRAEKYEEKATVWKKYLYISFIFLGVLFVLFLSLPIINIDFMKEYLSEDIIKYGYFSIILIKVIALIITTQVIRFFYKNYNANKHLENQSLHKRDVLRSLQGVYQTLEDKEARDELIKTGALTAFQNTESGYITTKEGAGGSDMAGLYSVIGSLLKK